MAWICSQEFFNKKPLEIFHKQKNKINNYEHQEDMQNIYMLVRKKFIYLKEDQGNLTIKISADDYYKLYINGKFIAQGPAPAYHFCYNYNLFDISEFLTEGENTIAVCVYYEGLINRVWNSGDYRQALFVNILDKVGNIILRSDDSWKYKISQAYFSKRTCGYNTQFLEDYDSNKSDENWQYSYYDENWKYCLIKNCDYIFKNYPVPLLQIYTVYPAEKTILSNGAEFYDFGREIVASLNISANGMENSSIKILCGEETDDSEYKTRFNMRCNCEYSENWLLKSGDNNVYQYNYKAFRYVTLIPNNAEIKQFSAMVRHYPFDDNAFIFESDNIILNKVLDLCKYTVKIGTQEAYLDCPSREKGQYLGDLFVTAITHIYLTGDSRLLKKAIDDFSNTNHICKGLLAVAPCSFMQEIADYSLLFPELLLKYYHFTGDKDFVKTVMPVCEGLVEYFDKFKRKDGLLDGVDKWNLVDWPDNYRDNYDFTNKPEKNGCHAVINAHYIGCIQAINQLYSLLNIKKHIEVKTLINNFNMAFYNNEDELYYDTEEKHNASFHSNVLAMYYGIADLNNNKAILDLIINKQMCCGVFFSFFYLKALAMAGKHDIVLNLITSTGNKSWFNMIKEGGTACFEAWGKEEKVNTSLCHPWATAPVIIIIEDMLGISFKNGEIDFKKSNYSDKFKIIKFQIKVKNELFNFNNLK